MMPLLELRDVTVRYHGRLVLDVPAFEVHPGERLAVMGPNGSGKSTLLRVLALLERPGSGVVRMGGQVPSGRNVLSLRRRMATVFQAPLLCDASVRRNVELGLRFRGLPPRERDRRAQVWLDRLGIAAVAERSSARLSGGEAQRTSLARAFVIEPEVLFLDEAFAALDPPTREALLLDIERILRDSGTTTVFVTHERSEALTMGDRLAIMMEGRIVQLDRPARVFRAPVSEAVARLVGIENLLPGRVRSASGNVCEIEVAGRSFRVSGVGRVGDRGLVCFRGEDLLLSRTGRPRPLAEDTNVLAGVVRRIAPSGGGLRVFVDAGAELQALLTPAAFESLGLSEGISLELSLRTAASHFIVTDRSEGGLTASGAA
jgi:tungstate transport system ATP-binding protein